MSKFSHLLIFLGFIAATVSGCKKTTDINIPGTPGTQVVYNPNVLQGDNDHMLMGNPNGAAPINDSFNNYLMRKTYYALSYNSTKGTPNWVSWHLFPADIGSTPRQDDFREDNILPPAFYHVQDITYSGSGFDRGHNCPSGDRTATIDANSSTFLMTNMIPQAPNNNQQAWAGMEDYVRAQIGTTKEAYTIMGSYGVGGTGSTGYATTIGAGHVTVPSFIWKVVVLLDNGSGDISRINAATRVIAVITPNTNVINSNWKTYRTSVDNIEAATGYNLLSALPANIQDIVEARIDAL